MEEGQVYQSSDQTNYVYDEVFPALPESTNPSQHNDYGKCNNKMRVGSSVITQVFRVPGDERRYDHNNSFGEKESLRTCSAIMKETGAVIEIATSKDQSLTFLVTGKTDSVMEARRKILSNFQTQASNKLSIPKEHHRWILGKSGTRLKELEKSTATKISVPGINDPSDEIVVTGTREGIDKAFHEMLVISDEQSKKAFERIPVLKHFHPFIAGAYNENVNALMNQTGTRIHIPPPSVQADEITIAGEKEGVAIIKDTVLKQLAAMEKYTTVSVEVPKMKHKYIFGTKGAGIADILQTTGVSVEMPPLDTQKETITLRGPQEKLGSALNLVYSKANSFQAVTVDAPSWIHKFIIGKKGANIKQITQDLSKVHVQFTEKEDKITIEGIPDEVEKAKDKLEGLTAQMVDKLAYETLHVDPKYYKHIIGRNGSNVNRLKEQTCVVINISESDQNVIRIEGNKEGVAKAKQKLEDMITKMELEKEKDVIIDWKYHKLLIGQKGDAIKETKEKFSQVVITFPKQEEKSDIVKLRGPKEEVDKCHKYLQKKVKEFVENSYQIQIPAYRCHKYIIGKKGANIQRLREETNASIDMPSEGTNSDLITIKGKRENVERAKEEILKIQKEQNNVVTSDVSIPPKMYNSLIGAGGKIIRSITDDCGGVSIKFPSTDSNSDKVELRGAKEDVQKAIKMLLDHVNEHEQSSYIANIRANQSHHKYLIGKSGSNINKIRESTGTRIIFPSDKDEDKELIVIQGKKEGVEQAKAELLAAIEKMDNVKMIEITVDQKHHKHFVARRCEMLHRLEEKYAGVTISFPRSGILSDNVTIKGPPDLIEPVRQKIADIVLDLEQRETIKCVIPQRHHRAIMGTKGSKVQDIEYRFDVKIKFPDRNKEEMPFGGESALENGDALNGETAEPKACDEIEITGKPKNCEEAAAALKASVPIVFEMEVPMEYHRGIIGQKGHNVRQMMNTYDVKIDVPSADKEENIIKLEGAPEAVENAKLGILEEMKKLDEEKEDRRLRSFKITLEVDPELHPKIIGRKGNNVTRLRDKFGVLINFPRRGDENESVISIQGYEADVMLARDDILSMVEEYNSLTKEEFEIDARIHARLIGSRGWSIRKIMDDYNVEIRFPRSGAANPNLITVIGGEESVFNAKDHLLNLEEEYIQEIGDDNRERPMTTIWGAASVGAAPVASSVDANARNQAGFIVKGAPWEHSQGNPNPNSGMNPSQMPPTVPKLMPDTASTQDFPTFGSATSASPAPSWGPRR